MECTGCPGYLRQGASQPSLPPALTESRRVTTVWLTCGGRESSLPCCSDVQGRAPTSVLVDGPSSTEPSDKRPALSRGFLPLSVGPQRIRDSCHLCLWGTSHWPFHDKRGTPRPRRSSGAGQEGELNGQWTSLGTQVMGTGLLAQTLSRGT